MILLAELLSGRRIDETGSFRLLDPATTTTSWTNLVAKYPEEFHITQPQTERWHLREAYDSEVERNWFAANFHLNRLLAMKPEDAGLRRRRDYARSHLDQEKATSP